jgi:hypothetical protein
MGPTVKDRLSRPKRVVSRACNHKRLCAPGGWSATGIARALGLALWELAKLAESWSPRIVSRPTSRFTGGADPLVGRSGVGGVGEPIAPPSSSTA